MIVSSNPSGSSFFFSFKAIFHYFYKYRSPTLFSIIPKTHSHWSTFTDSSVFHNTDSSKKTISAWKNHLITKIHDFTGQFPRRHYKIRTTMLHPNFLSSYVIWLTDKATIPIRRSKMMKNRHRISSTKVDHVTNSRQGVKGVHAIGSLCQLSSSFLFSITFLCTLQRVNVRKKSFG
jgi:hypothetical protein